MMTEGWYISDGVTTSDDAFCIRHEPPLEAGQELVPINYDDESDTPTHCSVCEALISHALTGDGLEYVWEGVTELLIHDTGRACIVSQWWEEYGDFVKEHLFSGNTEPTVELALLHVDEWSEGAPLRDDLSPDPNYYPEWARVRP